MTLDYLSIPGLLLILYLRCNLLYFITATSTAVEHVFSQGCHLLSFTCNQLSASSIHAFLCLGSLGQNDLIFFEDVLASVKANSKWKWELSEEEVVVE